MITKLAFIVGIVPLLLTNRRKQMAFKKNYPSQATLAKHWNAWFINDKTN